MLDVRSKPEVKVSTISELFTDVYELANALRIGRINVMINPTLPDRIQIIFTGRIGKPEEVKISQALILLENKYGCYLEPCHQMTSANNTIIPLPFKDLS